MFWSLAVALRVLPRPIVMLPAFLNKAKRTDASVAILEKGKEIGAHIISGAVMDPRGINDLMPDWKEKGAPIEKAVDEDHVCLSHKEWQIRPSADRPA